MRIWIFGRIYYLSLRFRIAAVCAAVLVLIIIGFMLLRTDREITLLQESSDLPVYRTPVTAEAATAAPAPGTKKEYRTPELFPVYLVGCIKQPGVVYVPEGAILQDAVLLAGGFTEEADPEAVNLACRLAQNMMIKVPSASEQDKNWLLDPGDDPAFPSAPTERKRININTAGAGELATLPGIGESTANKIIAYREANGLFRTPEDLMNVPGIKEGRYAELKAYITV